MWDYEVAGIRMRGASYKVALPSIVLHSRPSTSSFCVCHIPLVFSPFPCNIVKCYIAIILFVTSVISHYNYEVHGCDHIHLKFSITIPCIPFMRECRYVIGWKPKTKIRTWEQGWAWPTCRHCIPVRGDGVVSEISRAWAR